MSACAYNVHFTPVSDAPVWVVLSLVGVNAMLLDACLECTDVNLTTSHKLDTPPLSVRGLLEVLVSDGVKITLFDSN